MADQVNNGLILFDKVNKLFGSFKATHDLSFSLPQGKIIGLIGPSGCGKTTAIRLLTGIYQPTDGTIKVFGKEPASFNSSDRKKIGYLTQHFTLFPDLSVASNMNFAASMYGQGLLRRRKVINQLLELVELDKHRNKLAKNISGGMQRRLQLASTLIHDPELVILDEPTAGIDPILRRRFWEHFKELRDQGKTLFITTQYVSEAAYCDLVGVLADGKLLELCPPDELRKKAFDGEILTLKAHHSVTQDDIEAIKLLPYVKHVEREADDSIQVRVEDAADFMPDLMNWLQENNIEIDSLNHYQPPFDDVFVEIVQRHLKAKEEDKETSEVIS